MYHKVLLVIIYATLIIATFMSGMYVEHVRNGSKEYPICEPVI